jgi:glycosyltransferase involved in cell wall biosynthesis
LNPETPNLSVVVLAYRSAETIATFVDSLVSCLEANEPHWELILVGNYMENSDDRTPEVVKGLAKQDARIRAVTEVKEGMMGWDMKSGLKAASGKVLAVIDGDGQMPAEDVIRVYKTLREDNLDLAKTYRVKRCDGSYRRVISTVYNALFQFLFPGLNSRDINSKPKVMTRDAYASMDLKSDGWFIDAEIMIQARGLRLKTGEIETVFHSIDSRPSFVKPLSILEFLANLVWYRVLECFRSYKK